jgi:hypothetical protein
MGVHISYKFKYFSFNISYFKLNSNLYYYMMERSNIIEHFHNFIYRVRTLITNFFLSYLAKLISLKKKKLMLLNNKFLINIFKSLVCHATTTCSHSIGHANCLIKTTFHFVLKVCKRIWWGMW